MKKIKYDNGTDILLIEVTQIPDFIILNEWH